ncbi:hypothetical protein HY008_00225 [Candidatus Woesebacteria bacterium]|nr:hypothetical protein [Candidatus Woesebacteria bacterium]
MKRLKPSSVGLVLGTFAGGMHLLWSLLVLLGFAQPLLDWITWIHFLNNPLIVGNFEATRALVLIVVTFAVGYGVGFVLAHLWNLIQGK